MARSSEGQPPPATIAAIASGLGGGIGVVRLSGPRAEQIVARLVRPWPKGRAPSHKLHLGWVHDPDSGERIDQVLACVMRAPRSYTGEDVAELSGHGGTRVLGRVLDAVMRAGARPAEPGEFTRRAFEHGRLDLTRAEAVAELVSARSERALRAAQALAGGGLEREIRTLRLAVVRGLAEIEGVLDFPDEGLEGAAQSESGRAFAEQAARCRALAAGYRRADHERLEVVLVGRTNAGKSSLLNALAGEERALVDDAPGTTRDLVEIEIELAGATVRIVDTAGERFAGEAAGGVEERGVELGRKRRGSADAIVVVVDGTVGFGAGEQRLLDETGAQARLIVWNKRDLTGAPEGLPVAERVVETAATTRAGIEELRAALARLLADEGEEPAVRVGRRHADAIGEAGAALERAAALLQAGEPPELAAVEAREALHHLGRVTGETIEAELLDAIFARFCIGK